MYTRKAARTTAQLELLSSCGEINVHIYLISTQPACTENPLCARHDVRLRDAKTRSLLLWSFQSRTGDDGHPNHNEREKVFVFFS